MSGLVAVVGAGPGIGAAVARRFGQAGFRVALVARNQDRLEVLATALADAGIEAEGFAADVAQRDQIVNAFARITAAMGPVEVLEWGPWSGGFDEVDAVATDESAVEAYLAAKCLSTVTGVRQVLPGMLARRAGAVLITTGGAAVRPVPRLTPYAMAAAAERMYALQLGSELASTGVTIGIVTISAHVSGDALSGAEVADAHWDLYTGARRGEVELPGPAVVQ